MHSLAKLNGQAQALYEKEATWQEYAQAFTLIELVHLWYNYCVYREEEGKLIEPQAYDDEVYDALEAQGFFNYQ